MDEWKSWLTTLAIFSVSLVIVLLLAYLVLVLIAVQVTAAPAQAYTTPKQAVPITAFTQMRSKVLNLEAKVKRLEIRLALVEQERQTSWPHLLKTPAGDAQCRCVFVADEFGQPINEPENQE